MGSNKLKSMDRSLLESLYVAQKLSITEIAKLLKVGRNKVYLNLIRLSIPRRNLSESAIIRGPHPHTPESKQKIKDARIKDWQNPLYRQNQVEKQRVAMRGRLPKALANQNHRKTKPEIALEAILQRVFPGEWKYVGDGQVIIDGRNPDFINVNGKKAVIEMFGSYWHPIFDIARTRQFYDSYGFKNLIIWDDELANEQGIIKRVRKLCRK